MNHFIPLAQAKEMTKKYRDEKEAILIPELRNTGITPICESFDRLAFDTLLEQPGCVRLRTYLGMDADLKIKLITVGVNENDEDMLPSSNNLETDGEGGEIVEEGFRCPYTCPPPSALNED